MSSNVSQRPVAVVTGASRGIGKATVAAFEESGYEVVGISTRTCDVSSQENVQDFIENLIAKCGRIDVLVNSAAIYDKTPAANLTQKQWEALFATNVFGTFYCSQAVIPQMIRQKSGSIVNVSSVAARHFSKTLSVAYTASKYSILGVTRQMAAEFGPHGIRINSVAPAQVLTQSLKDLVPADKLSALADTVPLKRLAKPEEVAQIILFLCSPQSSYVNGAVIDMNGGTI
jgi:NAD(P)-dependent dehydrogenase (short-subunit alcohol dehydrogenase family)